MIVVIAGYINIITRGGVYNRLTSHFDLTTISIERLFKKYKNGCKLGLLHFHLGMILYSDNSDHL